MPENKINSELQRLLDEVKDYVMTDEEKEAQRQSWVRGQMAMMKADKERKNEYISKNDG